MLTEDEDIRSLHLSASPCCPCRPASQGASSRRPSSSAPGNCSHSLLTTSPRMPSSWGMPGGVSVQCLSLSLSLFLLYLPQGRHQQPAVAVINCHCKPCLASTPGCRAITLHLKQQCHQGMQDLAVQVDEDAALHSQEYRAAIGSIWLHLCLFASLPLQSQIHVMLRGSRGPKGFV